MVCTRAIFTWVRLAQRIPVRIHIDEVPDGVVLAAGMTATMQIDPRPRPQAEILCCCSRSSWDRKTS